MEARYVYCPEYDTVTQTCLVAHEYIGAPGLLPPLSADDGAVIGQSLLLAFVTIWCIGLIRKAASDRVES